MRDKLYRVVLLLGLIGTVAFVIMGPSRPNWTVADMITAVLPVGVGLAIMGFLFASDRFAKGRCIGEARFGSDGKVMEDE